MHLSPHIHIQPLRLALLCVLTLIAVSGALALSPAPAAADITDVSSTNLGDRDGDGEDDTLYLFKSDGDWWFMYEFTSWGNYFKWVADGNPDPEGSSGPKDMDAMIALAKQGGGEVIAEEEFFQTPAGKQIASGGGGPGSVWNPSDESPAGQKDPKAGIDEVDTIDFSGFGQSGKQFQPDGGSPSDQLKSPGGHGIGGGGTTGGGAHDGPIIDSAPAPDDDPWWTAAPVAPKVNPPVESAGR